MIVACHQPDLLPYTGFFHKMAKADVFVLLSFDQFQKHGYQRHVKMRGSWCSLSLDGKPHEVPIADVMVKPGWQQHLVDVIRGRYQGSTHWRERGEELCAAIISLPDFEPLAVVNTSLIRLMCDRLGITTRIDFSSPWINGHGRDRVLAHVLRAGGTVYLAGQGSKAYMGDDAESYFLQHGVAVQWSTHQPRSSDSILTAYFDEDDPMEAVLA